MRKPIHPSGQVTLLEYWLTACHYRRFWQFFHQFLLSSSRIPPAGWTKNKSSAGQDFVKPPPLPKPWKICFHRQKVYRNAHRKNTAQRYAPMKNRSLGSLKLGHTSNGPGSATLLAPFIRYGEFVKPQIDIVMKWWIINSCTYPPLASIPILASPSVRQHGPGEPATVVVHWHLPLGQIVIP